MTASSPTPRPATSLNSEAVEQARLGQHVGKGAARPHLAP